jgi:predicted HAD superfamily Cof-like phosphohydrolase
MNEFVKSVLEFHELFNQPIGNLVSKEDRKTRQLRIKLLFEELHELAVAGGMENTFYDLCAKRVEDEHIKAAVNETDVVQDHDNVDQIEEVDALSDIMYVLAGKIITGGYQGVFDKNFERVHRNNMTKAHRSEEHCQETIGKNPLGLNWTIIKKDNAFLLNNADGKLTKPWDHIKVKVEL